MSPLRPTVAIVGGGITGLVTARSILESSDALVVLFESASEPGGKIRTATIDGIRIEAGPDSFLARDPTAPELCDELGLADRLVAPAIFGAYIVTRGKPRAMPAGFPYGIPSSPGAALRAGLLSPWGWLRAQADLVMPGRVTDDTAIGKLVRRRLGRQVLDRLVDPLLGGTRAGRVDEMSLAAAAPQIYAVAQKGSLIKGVRAAQGAGLLEADKPAFFGLRDGMQTMIDALVDDLRPRASIRTGTTAEHVTSRAGHLTLHLDHGETMPVDALVLAVPAPAAAGIVEHLDDEAARALRAIAYADVAVITLAYPPGSVTPLPGGSGVLIPSRERRTLTAFTWSDAKWPHAAPADGRSMVRAFVGRADREPALDLDDDALARAAHTDVAAICGLDVEPVMSHVQRWDTAMPQYAVGHLDRLDSLQARLQSHRITLAGAGYRGSGIPDCIRQARTAATTVLEALTPR